jgi:signal transduction histidine kinase/ActR/RegA family two-component response regulator
MTTIKGSTGPALGGDGAGKSIDRLVRVLRDKGLEAVATLTPAAMLEALRKGEGDIVLLETGPAAENLFPILGQACARARPLPVLLLSQDPAERDLGSLVRAILECATDAILVTDERGTLVFASPGVAPLIGAAPAGRSVPEWLAAMDFRLADGVTAFPIEEQPLLQALRCHCEANAEMQLFSSEEGPPLSLVATARPLLDEAGNLRGAVAALRNVTEFRLLQQSHSQSQKMAALGRLAGGIAHDFNNLLTVINGYGELLDRQLNGNYPALELLKEIRQAGNRGAALTQQLLAVCRNQPPQVQAVDLNALVRETLSILARIIGESVELDSCLDPKLAPVRADPRQLEQVLLNLAVNARDAMPLGGRLLITTADCVFCESLAEQRPGILPGRYARLTVCDTGVGMSPEVKAHLFEPFFTTKAPGKGTGLGLAMVRDLVRQWGGHVEVESAPGQGATFVLLLPCCTGTAPAAEPGCQEELVRGPGGETVLLVEDDQAVRTLGRRALEAAGYCVLEAEHGPEALEICGAHHGPIHLLLTDLVLPRSGGRDLAQRLSALRPEMGTLLLSGYPDAGSCPEALEKAGKATAFLAKPFSLAGLVRKVRATLMYDRNV